MEQWRQLCIEAFDNDKRATDFILFVEGCGKTTDEGHAVTLNPTVSEHEAFRPMLEQLGFQRISNETAATTSAATYVLPVTTWTAYVQTKRKAREAWHEQLQARLSRQLDEALPQFEPLLLTHDQRMALVREFARQHGVDVGSVPFVRGLVGWLRFQLRKDQLAEWSISEYVLTQNGEEAMLAYLRLLRGVLGMTLVYRDPTENSVAIDMTPTEPHVTWRMSESLSDRHLSDILRALPQGPSAQTYQWSDIPRKTSPSSITHLLVYPQSLFQWLYLLIQRCFSFLQSSRA
ncbi:hypothetical protein EC973_007992 [Apophysomyces ossiformis]|uniref:Uncharacterized protein n=1 Tax=Apophysomyces ossiformis TaxID=679940 RepID=A0A8H7EQ40_9FUNG|nr:hypothetical protein EC973_007992 [Apophysomyces ossiformis]